MKYLSSILLLVLILVVPVPATRAGEPPATPILRIETGLHTAAIKCISVDAAERYVVTGSWDKTVRVWELATGRLLRTLRPPIGPGNDGKIYAAAISPDGETIACGGLSLGNDIYLFNRSGGQLRQRLAGLPIVINRLVYSPDGRYLAAALGGHYGIRVYRTADYQLVAQDANYGGQSYGLAFSTDGRLASTCNDGYLRLYDPAFKLAAKVKAPSGSRPTRITFSPDGAEIAVGSENSTGIDVFAARDLVPLFAADTHDVTKGHFYSVAWSRDGHYLYAGGNYFKDGNSCVRRWDAGGRGAPVALVAVDDTIMDLQPLRGGGVVFGAADPAWGVLEASGRRSLFLPPAIADYRDNGTGFTLSPDAAAVRFGYQQSGKEPALFDVAARALQLNGVSAALQAPRLEAAGLTVTKWKNNYSPQLNGRPLALEHYERSRSLAIAPDGERFLLGCSWSLRCFDRTGKQLWSKPAQEVAWAVNVAGNGQVGVAAYGDGTIRWHRMSDGEELLTFFPHADKKRWVCWTPSGYYDCSPGGEELIGWHINNGKDKAADFFPASRFRETYHRPDIVQQVLKQWDEGAAIRVANAEAGRKTQVADVARQLPPVVTLLSPADNAEVRVAQVTLRYSVRSADDAPVTAVRALVDGRPAGATRDLRIVADSDSAERTLTITVPQRDCEISLVAENRFAASVPATARLKWRGAPPEEFTIKPKLYVLAIGVGDYADEDIQLTYPGKDARDFTAAITAQKGSLYRDVEVKVLADKDAVKDNIVDGLDWIQHATTAKDVAMIFLSGHGYNDPNGTYYFLPQNFRRDKLRATGLAYSEVTETVKNTAGKVVCFVDSCHSGNVMGEGKRKGMEDINKIINELSSVENGAVVFSSSSSGQVSFEDRAWGNGAFTKALVEGLNGKADYNHNGRITINMLDLYISERVKALTGGKQTPTTAKPPSVPDFPIAVK